MVGIAINCNSRMLNDEDDELLAISRYSPSGTLNMREKLV
jgi:hypothetical protein